jgi:hypothetical protein
VVMSLILDIGGDVSAAESGDWIFCFAV